MRQKGHAFAEEFLCHLSSDFEGALMGATVNRRFRVLGLWAVVGERLVRQWVFG